jgi:transposase
MVVMYIERVKNRNSPPAILLRESYRQDGKVLKRTIANLSKWPDELVEGLQVLLHEGMAIKSLEDGFDIIRSLPHGHVAAVLGTLRNLGLDNIIDHKDTIERRLAIAIIVARIIFPGSKLATARGLSEKTAASSLHEELGLGTFDEDDLYKAMDWLLERQESIEKMLADKHLEEGSLVLYDVTSTYFEGHCCPLGQRGFSKDKGNHLQIVFGLLCNVEGCPVAVEVFEGNTGDARTLTAQIQKVRERFGLKRVIWVGDRGTITEARINEEMKTVEGLQWITALRTPAIRVMVEDGALQLSLFDERDMAEIRHPDYPGERLIACRNPLMADRRAHKRQELLVATERELDKIVQATKRTKRPMRGKDAIGLRVGKVIGKYKMGKHFELEISDEGFSYRRNEDKITQEAALDGIYVIRTSVPAAVMDAQTSVKTYKKLSDVERAFRSYKTVDLKVRPIYHHLPDRVRAHVFLCMLAYYVEWHMRQNLAPVLFDDDDVETAAELRESVVAPAERSPRAMEKTRTKHTDEGQPVHSFQTLLKDLATIAKQSILPKLKGAAPFRKITIPTSLQQKTLDLLRVKL